MIEGRMFRGGTSEIIAGRSIASGFQGAGLGETLHFAQRDWLVVGVFDAGRTGFDSEVWGDAEQMLQAFRRTGFSAVTGATVATEDAGGVSGVDRAGGVAGAAEGAEVLFPILDPAIFAM